MGPIVVQGEQFVHANCISRCVLVRRVVIFGRVGGLIAIIEQENAARMRLVYFSF